MSKVKESRKYLLDANIYGEMVIDTHIEELKEDYENCKNMIIVYGIKDIIRKELRATPKDAKVGERKVRSNLLGLYDIFTGRHELLLREEHKRLAEDYYNAYRKLGGSKPKNSIFNDFIVVACASFTGMDVVVSEDERTMLTENAIKAYNFVNNINKKRTPKVIGYTEFKYELRSCLSNKFISGSNKFGIFLIFLNFFYKFAKINLFPFHAMLNNYASINIFCLKC